jgi:DNA polymerase-3 subunit epsilon
VRSVGEAATIRGGKNRIKPQKQHLAEHVPNTPGVYYFVDKKGGVLYVGKAKDLKARVRTYFNGGDGRRKVGRLVEEVAEVRSRRPRASCTRSSWRRGRSNASCPATTPSAATTRRAGL